MFDTSNMFNGMFGKVKPGMCKISMNGGIAISCSNGYKTYNLKKDRLTNVSSFCLDIPDAFFVIPTNRVAKGDIIIVAGKPKCVLEVNKNSIKVIDYENSEIREVVPERHVFMGNTYFYGKIVSLFGNMKSGKGFGGMMKMMMMSQLFGGNNGSSQGGMFSGNNMGQMMAMSMIMGDKDNPFDEIIGEMNFDFNNENTDEAEEEDDNEE